MNIDETDPHFTYFEEREDLHKPDKSQVITRFTTKYLYVDGSTDPNDVRDDIIEGKSQFEHLQASIRYNSYSKEWEKARFEWYFIWAEEGHQTFCVCNQYNITAWKFIENKINNKQILIGSDCVLRFRDNKEEVKELRSQLNNIKKHYHCNLCDKKIADPGKHRDQKMHLKRHNLKLHREHIIEQQRQAELIELKRQEEELTKYKDCCYICKKKLTTRDIEGGFSGHFNCTMIKCPSCPKYMSIPDFHTYGACYTCNNT